MEVVLAIAIFALAGGGLGLGLMLGRAPAQASCAAADGLASGRCADCPLRKRAAQEARK